MAAAITACNRLRWKMRVQGRTAEADALNAYHCGNCGSYHVGHLPGRVAAQIEARRTG